MNCCSLFKQVSILNVLFFQIYCSPTIYAQQTQIFVQPKQTNTVHTSQIEHAIRLKEGNERQRQIFEDEITKTIIPDAVFVIDQIKLAISQIHDEENQLAKESLEKAKVKMDALSSRQPTALLLPIDFEITEIDTAPIGLEKIKSAIAGVLKVMNDKELPEARFLLNNLRSEMNVDTYAIALDFYSALVKKALSLLDSDLGVESAEILQDALHSSFVIITRIIPIPLVHAVTYLSIAEHEDMNNKDLILQLLEESNYELERARELGYTSKNKDDYSALKIAIKDLKSDVEGGNSQTSRIGALKNRFRAFIKKYWDKQKMPSKNAANIGSQK